MCLCFAPQRRATFPDRNFKNGSEQVVFCPFWVTKCASRHRGVPLFQIATSKMAPSRRCFVHFDLLNVLRATAACHFSRSQLQKMSPSMRWFVHFDLQMCFAPQRRSIFPDRNVQNGSDHEVFCAFWLTNVLRATAACHFSGSQRPKWLRAWGVLYILTYKCASRHSGVPFFISPLDCYLRTRRFSEATFVTSGSTNHWQKHSDSRLS